jgi:hypothetical protein
MMAVQLKDNEAECGVYGPQLSVQTNRCFARSRSKLEVCTLNATVQPSYQCTLHIHVQHAFAHLCAIYILFIYQGYIYIYTLDPVMMNFLCQSVTVCGSLQALRCAADCCRTICCKHMLFMFMATKTPCRALAFVEPGSGSTSRNLLVVESVFGHKCTNRTALLTQHTRCNRI